MVIGPTMKSPFRATILAATCSAVALGIGSLLPLWKLWRIDGCLVSRKATSLWAFLAHVHEENIDLGWEHRLEDMIPSMILVTLASVTGLVEFRIARPRIVLDQAKDYAEGPNGAIAEGQAVQSDGEPLRFS